MFGMEFFCSFAIRISLFLGGRPEEKKFEDNNVNKREKIAESDSSSEFCFCFKDGIILTLPILQPVGYETGG